MLFLCVNVIFMCIWYCMKTERAAEGSCQICLNTFVIPGGVLVLMLLTMMMTVISLIGASVELDLIKISVVRQRGISWIYQGFRQGGGMHKSDYISKPLSLTGIRPVSAP